MSAIRFTGDLDQDEFTPVAVEPCIKRCLQGRRLFVFDIENVAGGGLVSRELADWAVSVVVAAFGPVDGEQVVIGTSRVGLFNAKAAWNSARVAVRSGENGADLELLNVLANEGIDRRFEEVILISGDGIFTDVVSELSARGVRVTVASWAESMSLRLRLAAGRTVYLDDSAARCTYEETA